MVGTRAGGLKAAKTNKERYGEDFYKTQGKKGGLVSTPNGGFGSDKVGNDGLTGKERAKIAGAKGGHTSRRGPATRDADGNLVSKDGKKYTGGRPKKAAVPEPEKKGLFSKIFGGE